MTDIYFPVKKVAVEDIMPGYDHPSGINHAIVATLPDGEQRVLQYCSEIYELVPNQTIIPPFEEALSKHYKIEKEIRMDRYARFFIDFVIKEHGVDIGRGKVKDEIFPRITLINSYDGSIKYNFMAGFFRLICTNGMMVQEGEIKQIKSMHTPKIGRETSYENIMEMVSEFLGVIEDTTEVYHELEDQEVSDWMMRIEEVTEATNFPATLQEDVMARMGLELDTAGVLPTDWIVYNAFNYQLNHNTALKAKHNKKDAMDQEVLEYLIKY